MTSKGRLRQEEADSPIIIASIDSLHPMAGIVQKFRAFQQFLREYEDYRDKVMLIQFIPSTLCVSDNLKDRDTEESKS